MSIAIIGDVHGDYYRLMRMINLLHRKQIDEIFSVGDLIDRGPESKQVVDLCIAENIKTCMGNHEEWMINYLKDHKISPDYFSNAWGTKPTFISYGCTSSNPNVILKDLLSNVPDDHVQFYKSLQAVMKITLEDQIYWVTHSGISPQAVDLEDDALIDYLYRSSPWNFYFSFPNLKEGKLYNFKNGCQVFGHQIVQKPIVTDKWIALDTGCGTCPPWKLSAVILPEREVIQI